MTKYTPELAESRPGNPDTVFSYNALGDFELILKSSLGGGGGLLNLQTFTSDGTYTPTAGTNSILVICTAGGGGTGNGGSAGGLSSFGAFCSATGGGGGGASGNAGTGGAASGGNINILGGGGGKSDSATGLTTPPQTVDEGGLMGGSSFWGGGGRSMRAPSGAGPAYATDPGRAYGSGAGGASERSSGGAGGTAIGYITSGFSSVPVTVGSGGAPADASGEAGAGGIVVVLEYGDGDEIGHLVQSVATTTNAVSTPGGTIPFDNTIPQSSEGTQLLSVNITPISATSTLKIRAKVHASIDTGEDPLIMALFQNADVDAIATSSENLADNNPISTVTLEHTIVAGTTSPITFNLNVGKSSLGLPGTITINGSGGVGIFGGTLVSSLEVIEILG